MSAQVDLDRLTDALSDYDFAYLITVTDDYRVRTVEVTPIFDQHIFKVRPVGEHTRANLSRHGSATLVWPPRTPGDYSLIVDVEVAPPVDGATSDSARLVPARALLHRPIAAESPTSECGGDLYDCVILSER